MQKIYFEIKVTDNHCNHFLDVGNYRNVPYNIGAVQRNWKNEQIFSKITTCKLLHLN